MVKDLEKLLVVLNRLGDIRGRTRFQKILYLLKEKDNIDLDYDFIPYYYGPYSRGLQLEINLLEAADFVQVEAKDDNLYVHSLTEKGKAAAKEIEQKIEKEERMLLNALKKYKRRSTSSLIREAKKLTASS